MKQTAYLASPFGFSESAKHFMDNVYVPRLSEVVGVINPWDLTTQAEIDQALEQGDLSELRKEIGGRNTEAIIKADIVIAALDGQEPDSGTVAEIGFATGVGKRVYGYRNDFRQAGELKAPFNLQVEYFIHISGGRIAYSLEELVSLLRVDQGFASSPQANYFKSLLSQMHAPGLTKVPKIENLGSVVNFLFEVGILAHTPRSYTFLLGSGEESVAEHINRVSYVGMVLALMNGDADVGKVLEMCLLHDLAEARTSDLNYVYQRYVESDDEKVIEDLASSLSFGNRVILVLRDYKQRQSIESRLTKDADTIDLILSLKEQADVGNTRAASWLAPVLKRLKTEEGRQLADVIVKTNSDEWWFANKDDDWWVNRNSKKR